MSKYNAHQLFLCILEPKELHDADSQVSIITPHSHNLHSLFVPPLQSHFHAHYTVHIPSLCLGALTQDSVVWKAPCTLQSVSRR